MPEVLQLTTNGEIDRRALPALDYAQVGCRETFVAPQNQVQEQLAGIWSKLLHLPSIGIHDNFFEVGGHSLLAVQLLNQVQQQLGKSLSLAVLFQRPTIAQLAEALLSLDTLQKPFVSVSDCANAHRRLEETLLLCASD